MSRQLKAALIVTLIVLITGVSIYAAVGTGGWSATLLAPDALQTDAPQRVVNDAMWAAYNELRLQHFRDPDGFVRFPDGTSTDTTFEQSSRRSNEFVTVHTSFDAPDGNRIDIRSYHTPYMDTLFVWEYEGASDVQMISVALQKQLAKQGVTLK